MLFVDVYFITGSVQYVNILLFELFRRYNRFARLYIYFRKLFITLNNNKFDYYNHDSLIRLLCSNASFLNSIILKFQFYSKNISHYKIKRIDTENFNGKNFKLSSFSTIAILLKLVLCCEKVKEITRLKSSKKHKQCKIANW